MWVDPYCPTCGRPWPYAWPYRPWRYDPWPRYPRPYWTPGGFAGNAAADAARARG